MPRSLGELIKLNPRDVWPNEAQDFTPWVAENLQELGSVLGLELELEAREVGVGPFSLDLLARDLNGDRPVVIENQFGPTDHDHLGKLLTYAAGLDGGVVVWIGENFREEHRQALDWLNQRTDGATHFFGVGIEVFQVDESRPAVRLQLIAKPNQWQKIQKARGASAVSERGERYRQYFQELIDELREEHRFTNARIAQPVNWYSFASGTAGVTFGAVFTRGSQARTELYIGTSEGETNHQLFNWLKDRADDIQREVGADLEWEDLEDKLACRIALYRDGAIESDAAELREIRAWHLDKLLRFDSTFRKRLEEFKRLPRRPADVDDEG